MKWRHTMSYIDWKDKTDTFKKVDVRGIAGNFFQGLKKQAMQLEWKQVREWKSYSLSIQYHSMK